MSTPEGFDADDPRARSAGGTGASSASGPPPWSADAGSAHAPGPDRPGAGAAETTEDEPAEDERRAWAWTDRRRRRREGRLDRALPIALGVAGGLLLAQMVTAVLGAVQGLLTVVVVSLFLSFAMEPAVQWLHRRGVRRGLGTWMVFLLLLLFLGGFLAAMAPLVVDQMATLVRSGPGLLGQVARQAETLLPGETGQGVAQWLREQRQGLPVALPEGIGLLGRGALGFGQTVLGGLVLLLSVGLVTFYLVAEGPRLRFRLASRLSHREQVRVLGLWELAIAKTGGYVYSRVFIAVTSAVFHVLAFALIGLEYALALGVWMGVVSSIVPVVGTYIGGLLPLIVALAASPVRALLVLVAIVVYQQVENYLIMPRITSRTMQLHPAVAFLSVLAGGALAGATGALLALPAVAIATALLSASAEEYDVLEHHLVEAGSTDATLIEDHPSHRRHRAWIHQRMADDADSPPPSAGG